jgi:hypothetical protein
MNKSTTSSEKSFVERTEQENDFSLITERFIANPEEVLSIEKFTVAFLTKWLTSPSISKLERKQILNLILRESLTNHKELVTSLQWIITQQKVTLTREFLISCYQAHIVNDSNTEHMSSIKAHALWHPRMPISLVIKQAGLEDTKESMVGQIGMIKKPWQSLEYAKNYMKRTGLLSNEAIPEHMVWKIMNWDNWMKDALASAK